MPDGTQEITMRKAGSTKVWVIPAANAPSLKAKGWIEVPAAATKKPQEEGAIEKVGRGATLGVFSGIGIPETKTPVQDFFKGNLSQLKQVYEDLQKYGLEGVPGITALRLAKSTGAGLAESGKETYRGAKGKD